MPNDLFHTILSNYKKTSLTPDEEKIKQVWSQPMLHPTQDVQARTAGPLSPVSVGGGWPDVTPPEPPPLYPTNVSPTLAKPLADLLKIYPALSRQLGHVQTGPDAAFGDLVAHQRAHPETPFDTPFYPEDFKYTNLLGLTSTGTDGRQNIAINPRLPSGPTREDLVPTLGHELTHAAGYPDEDTPESISSLLQKRELGKLNLDFSGLEKAHK
jgi:hypothetical protein